MFTDWEDLDLMNGRMHIYFGEDYVGKASCVWTLSKTPSPFHSDPTPTLW